MELERIDPVTILVPSKLIKTQFQEFDFPSQSYTISGRHLSIFNNMNYIIWHIHYLLLYGPDNISHIRWTI